METKKIEIYSTDTCHFCHMAKDWLNEKGISFTDYNVGTDIEKRKEMVDLTGQMGVPVIKIGEEIIIGFDQNRIEEILAK